MKIGIDARCLMSSNYSGVSWYAFNLLQSLFELDKKNSYFLFYNNSRPVEMPKLGGANVRYVGFKYPNKLLNSGFGLFNNPKIDRMLGGVDKFFMPNMNFSAFSSSCKNIITVHDLSYLRYPQFWTLKSRAWHKALLFKRVIQNADAVIAVSRSTKKDLIDLLAINEKKIKVIYEGVEEKFRPVVNNTELSRVRKKYKLPESFVLYLGTLEPRKNVEGIIEAYNKLSVKQSLIIGGGEGWKYDKIKKLVDKNDRIKLIGYVDECDKRGLYTLADLLIYPSYYEGFGLPPIEAMACGTPVIAGSNSSQVEVVGEAGVLVDPYNLNEVALAMDYILKNDVVRSSIREAGFINAKRFNWHKTAEETLKLFSSL